MSKRALSGLLVAFMIAACQTPPSAPSTPPMQALAPVPADLPPQYARFYGAWSGKWDNVWDVTFVVDRISNTGSADGHYYWKEQVNGPWSHDLVSGDIHGDTLTFDIITITLDPTESTKATAVGKFATVTRTAKLTKL
jgi:hypothetical protein